MASPAAALPTPAPVLNPEEEAATLKRINDRVQHWEDGLGKDFHLKCEKHYDQYRGFTKWQDDWRKVGPRDRDGWVREARKEWGAQLHIPLSYRTIETVIPRAIAHAPHILVMPRQEEFREGVEQVQLLLDAQQQQINIDLPYQDVMRAGQIYGLGVGKTFWDYRTRNIKRQRPAIEPKQPGEYLLTEEKRVEFDDPRFESLDIFDFLWDPYGYSMDNCGWTAQKLWLTLDEVMKRLPANGGLWDTPGAQELTEDAVRKLPTADARYTKTWNARMRASGFNVGNFSAQGEHIHEVVEYHDGTNVYTVLDRKVLVRVTENPCGAMPFQIYRPVPLLHQMVGIGALEPLEHLQRELDTLRSQRRDLVTLALCAGYAFDATLMSEEDLQFGPAAAIAIDGDPRTALMPLTVREVPGSGYQEEQSIRLDIEAVSGESDALDNSPGGSTSTATEAQLVQAALGRRIELGARRFEIEVVRESAQQFLYLDQREIVEQRTLMRPGDIPSESDGETARYKWFKIGPGELEGEYQLYVEGGSMAAKNIPQERSDAERLLAQVAHDPFADPVKPRLEAWRKMGVKHPESWLRGTPETVPVETLGLAVQMGCDPGLLQKALIAAREKEANGQQEQQAAPA